MADRFDEMARKIAQRTVDRLDDIGALDFKLPSVEHTLIADRIAAALRTVAEQAAHEMRERCTEVARRNGAHECDTWRDVGHKECADEIVKAIEALPLAREE